MLRTFFSRLTNSVLWLCTVGVISIGSLSRAQTYSYGLDGRLIAATYANGNQVSYAYDRGGNISAIATNSGEPNTNATRVTISSLIVTNAGTNSTAYMFSFTWGSAPGLTYEVQYATNVTSTNWNVLGFPIAATNTTITATDIINTNRQRFYRVVILP